MCIRIEKITIPETISDNINGVFTNRLNVGDGTIVVHIATSEHRTPISAGVDAQVPGSEKIAAIRRIGYRKIISTGG
tara:strand:+ start:686 stop:916 length:231 start_codon:yes stop_codon:yes gene_type:complete